MFCPSIIVLVFGALSVVLFSIILYLAYQLPTPTPDAQASKEVAIKVSWIILISQIVVTAISYWFFQYLCNKQYVKTAWAIFVVLIVINSISGFYGFKMNNDHNKKVNNML